jgi:hypothetical protein
MQTIISLREQISTGRGLTKVITAVSHEYFNNGMMVRFEQEDGVIGELPVRNVTGIITKEVSNA